MKNKSEPITKTADNIKVNKVVLTEDIIYHIHNYSQDILKPGLEQIYKILNNITTLRKIPLIDCPLFEEICKSALPKDPDFADSLIILNAIFQSGDVESLATCELYGDVLNGKFCTRSTSTMESFNIIHAMRTIILSDYEQIINTLEVKYLGDN